MGFYRLRIRIKYTSGLDPCGTTTYGEVEDYSFELTAKVPNEWTGASNSYWNQAGNWSLGHKPTPDENVLLTMLGISHPLLHLIMRNAITLRLIQSRCLYHGKYPNYQRKHDYIRATGEHG
ncbi:MAG: GEVED domain-containing protein [Bacteroidales bacterium]